MSQDEVVLEQSYVDRLYARLDVLRARVAAELANVRRSGPSGTHQNRSERDSFAGLHEQRLSQLEAVEDRLAFGRVDLRDGTRRYIGRLGLSDDEQTQLLVDWRAPAAREFYQATAASPGDVVRRRHLATRGRSVTGVEDEALDLDSMDQTPAQLADRRGRPAGRGRRAPDRPDGRHRRDHPGRAGPGDPQRPGRPAGRAGRTGHRQDGRRAAPRGVPAVHPPRTAEPQRRAHRRPEPVVPALHRAGAAVAGRDRRRALDGRRALSRSQRRARDPGRRRRAQGRPADGGRPRPRGAGPPAGARRSSGAGRGQPAAHPDPRRRRRGPGSGPPQPQAAQQRPRGLPA